MLAPAEPPAKPGRRLALVGVFVGVAILGAILAGLMARDPQPVSPQQAVPAPSVSPVPQPATPQAPAVPADARALDAKRSGTSAYDTGDVQGSLEHFRTAADASPNDPEALNKLGQVLVRTGKPLDAIQYFDRAIALAGTTWAYRFNRARAYGLAGQWARAAAGYQDALRLFPDDYATQFNLAKALEANGDLQGAIAGYARAIELAPGQGDFHLAHGRALEAARRVPEAMAAYARFLDLAPGAPEADKVRAHYDQLKSQP